MFKVSYCDHPVSSVRRQSSVRGGRVVQWCWINFQCRSVLLIWIRVGQGPTALAVGADGGCLGGAVVLDKLPVPECPTNLD